LAEASQNVIDLLTYIEEVEKLKTKPAFSVTTEFFVAYQQELKGLPEIRFNLQSEGDDVWLKVPRIQEISAPNPGENLRAWVTLSKSADKKPELKTECVFLEGKKEVDRYQLSDHPEIKEHFDWYVENQWEPWSAAERPRRKTISIYNKLFALQQTISSEGSETPIELVWGLGYSTWKKEGQSNTVKCPMLVQACEIVLNSRTFDLEVRPRDVDARLEIDCYTEMEVPGVRQLEEFWKSVQTNSEIRINPFESSTYEGVLKAAVGHLDPTGGYDVRTDDVTLPPVGDKLLISNTWVLYGRKRSGDIFLEDIRRLKETVEAAQSLPSVICSFVEEGDTMVRVRPEVPFRGLSTSDGSASAKELYFPMPYNDEQVSIIQKLEANDGVVVQGPPGTGKTHTIANVICHYLAMGKRVLVTSKGETALSVLQEKLPERIRTLSVALLSEEREGMKQFEHAIQSIATGVESIQPQRVEANINRLDAELNQLHAKISHVDRMISTHAASHMREYKFQGRDISPEELAKLVLQQADEYQWMDDEIPEHKGESFNFSAADITSLWQARIKAGHDLSAYLSSSLPPNDDLPAWADLVVLHRDILRSKTIEASVESGSVLALIDSKYETFNLAQKLLDFLDQYVSLKTKLHRNVVGAVLIKRMAEMQPQDQVLAGLLDSCEKFKALEAERKQIVTKAIGLPEMAEKHADFLTALNRLVDGKSAFALPFGKAEARQLVSSVTVLGSAPEGRDGWVTVQAVVKWRDSAHREVARWSAISAEFGLNTPVTEIETTVRHVVQQQSWVENAKMFVFDVEQKLHGRLEEVFGKKIADQVWDKGVQFLEEARSSLTAHLDKGRLGYAMKRVSETLDKLRDRTGPAVEDIRQFFLSDLGAQGFAESELQSRWLELQTELSRLNNLTYSFGEINRVTGLVEASGAPKWANRLRTIAHSGDSDPVLPIRWREAWSWRLAFQFLEKIDVHKKLRVLFEERRALTASLSSTYQDLVAEKTWLGVFNNSPQSIRQALQSYLNSIHAMGAGKGIRAVRHRRHARDAMQKAYMAVPCWVLPQWRVSETLPPEIGLFDLVIIDEASQSDIWALPSLLRGKKLLVVGDHKQVSPSAVGLAEQRIVDLEQRFLRNQFHGAQMTPDKSIYDLARVVFAGNSVMLKEHFRCVPAIIEFSNREFYNGNIKPLRVPKANERLDPPLIDVFVKGGHRKGDANAAEAEAIVNEVQSIIINPEMVGRSIGIVTLLGNEQAKYINDLINERITPGNIVERKIAVGPPPIFQGRERDIMMVSMVLGAGDRTAATIAAQQQRFNVALSRARDRMYLFRSVAHNHFDEDSLSGKVLRHFRQPFNQDIRRVALLRDLCESGFEKDLFDELTQRGYRVQPQVPCGSYRIDFVVEGGEGRRLALECDGDRFHGPGQWSDDMARQRVLERAGWTFWRCFASSFTRRRQEVLEDLLSTLEGLGIEPLGAESMDNTVWVETREVDPFGVDESPEEQVEEAIPR
jgi:very-short-patch-repair endonuclease